MYKRNTKGRITVGENDLAEVVRVYDSPLYVFDFNYLQDVYRKLRGLLHPQIDLYYAVKANPNPHIVKQYMDLGAGLDLSSIGEMLLARRLGVDPHRTSLAGPAKTGSHLLEAINNNVGMLSVESLSELENIATIAESIGRLVNVTIRINPSKRVQGFSVKMGGIPSQFGIDQERLPAVLEFAANSEWIEIDGIHVYSGTQSLDADAIVDGIKNTLQIAESDFENHGISLKKINLGGGFGVAYYEGEVALDEKRLVHAINKTVDDYLKRYPQTQFILELGRYLVASSGIYVATVVRRKESRGSIFLVLDGGMNHYLALSGNFGQVFRKNFPVIHGSKVSGDGKEEKYHLVGALCTVLDRVGTDVQLPVIDEGDLLVFPLAGAYSYTASPLMFLSHPAPAEVAVKGREVLEIRKRQYPESSSY